MKGFMKKFSLFALLLFLGLGSNLCYASESQGINVNYHTQKEIRDYLKKNKVDIYEETSYGTAASNTSPYKAGTVSDDSLQSALNTMNAIRYIAGIDGVALDSTYTKKAQAAALVNSANSTLSHYPVQPSGMGDSLYELGKAGAGSSNLSWTSWKTGLGYHLAKAWMNDGDSSNIDRVGHRRWILNPAMEKTGFGWVYSSNGTYAAMYAFDNWYGETGYYGVAWPAQNMPVEYFGNTYPWSISMGSNVDGANVKVTLTRKSDNKKWTFSKSSADGYFNVENSNYGQKGCIIFRPDSISYQPGDQFTVEVSGLSQKASYNVSFFSTDVDEGTCSHSYGTAQVTQKATLTTNGKKTSTCSKCGKTKTTTIYKASLVSLSKDTVTYNGKTKKPQAVVKNSKGKAISSKYYTVTYKGTPKKSGMYQVTVKFKGDYSGTKNLTYTIQPKGVTVKNTKPLKKAVWITTQKGEDITGYEIVYSTGKGFKPQNTETVTIKGKDKTKNKITGLKSDTTYFVKVRTYKTVTYNGKKQTLYSTWSKAKTIKTR
ncbi:MAG: CAP domain-containing protein [Clostridiales bacterium]|nr:CAP domain-containing protein [Clostridiales bacterium]